MIDAHIHLSDKRFDTDREKIIRTAEENGVTAFFCVSSTPSEWENIFTLARKNKNIHPFIGTHPWYASKHDVTLFKEALLRYPSLNVGEIGLDAIKGEKEQESVFESQLVIAAELKRSCVIHCVKSFDSIAAILKRLKTLPPALLFHGYSGTVQQAEFLIRFNSFFSFSGNVLFSNKEKARQVLTAIPNDRLLIETDAPDMLPPEEFCLFKEEPRNIPANLPLIVQEFAKIKKTDTAALTRILHQNAKRFLNAIPTA